ncbi:ATP-binding protein [Lachnoclostridium sp. 210928-DFI.6.3]|nr:ATP-binding protein [Lachnoclostridium sp. 210928-DFI.6.3]
MNYTEKTKPGMGDPYWYEWSVGEQQIINMLNEDNNIEYVELQANVGLGLDDVVVTYRDGKVLCIQVKHTRADDTLTFADLVYSAKKTSKSLLAELADSWQEESRRYTEVIPQVFTNRRKGQIISTTKGKDTFVRPALDVFWKRLNEKIKSAKNFEDIVFEEYPEAWNEWKTQLSGIQSNNDKLKFLRLLQLETEQKDLQEIENEVLGHLSTAFRITLDDADKLLGKLDHALRKWTTSGRNTSRIYVEDVYAALSIDDYISPYNHELMPAEPFFDSRKDFVEEIEKELLLGNEKVLFLSGIPGTGKTNIVSKLCNKRDSIIKIRYYAYEPIQPDKEYLPIDVSERVKKEHFWNEMFSQLKQCLKGSLHKYNVPLQNCFMSLEEMKKHFFEIASAYARDTGCTFVIAIDGIDHAARAGIVSETFLATLPRPEYIPDNIKLLISGQPQESYPNYPLWLKRKNDSVKRLDVPGIERGDILSLVTQKISDTRSSEYNVITDIVEKYAEKNTLAAIFAVYEASQCADAMKLERKLSDRKLSGNIEEYYSNIWNDTVGTLKQYDFVDYKLAGVFAFFNERVNGQILSEIFNELNIPVAVWNDVLKTLKPLIVEEAGKYHVLHNDVKVFLSNIVKIDNEHIEEVASSLVNYYLHKKEKSQAFYFDIIRLMYMANKQEEISDIFSSKFVIEAYVNGVEILELKSIAKEIMKRLFKQEKIDYIKLQSLSTTILTINKIKYTKDEINSIELRNIKPYIGVASYECYVEPISKWDACLISEVLSYAKELYFSGEKKHRFIYTLV